MSVCADYPHCRCGNELARLLRAQGFDEVVMTKEGAMLQLDGFSNNGQVQLAVSRALDEMETRVGLECPQVTRRSGQGRGKTNGRPSSARAARER